MQPSSPLGNARLTRTTIQKLPDLAQESTDDSSKKASYLLNTAGLFNETGISQDVGNDQNNIP